MALFNKDSVSPEPEESNPAAPRRGFGSAVSTIGAGMTVSGTISGSADTIVIGRVEGELSIQARLRIEKDGRVEATTSAEEIEIAGTVEGTITARRRIEIEKTAIVSGSVSAPVIVIHEGATLNGRVSMSKNGSKQETEASR